MSDLSNLYISQSYKGLINFADSTQGFPSQSDHQLQDGLGNGIGISIETGSYNVTLTSSLFVNSEISSSTVNGIGNVETYSASVDLRLDEVEATASDHDKRVDAIELYTSSLKDAFSVSGTDVDFKGDVRISGSLSAYEIHTITESASVIFSSGSNILGDEPTDTQVLSGSVYVPNLHYLAFNPKDTNLRINEKLDTGSFLIFSASVEDQLEQIVQDALPSTWTGSVFIPFSASVDTRLVDLELFSQSLVLDTASFQQWTASVFEPFSTSVDERLILNANNIDKKLDSASFENWTSSVYLVDSASFDSRIDTKLENSWTSSVFEPYSASVYQRVQSLIDKTGSYATTASNAFFGSQSIDGDVTITGSTIIDGELTHTGNTTQSGDFYLTGQWEQTGSQEISGNSTIQGTLSVFTSASIDGGWHVTGSSHYSGSVKGNVVFDSSSTADPADFTHSIDCSKGNFFDFYLKEGENLILAENIYGGETITVRLNQPSGSNVSASYAEVVWDTGSIKFPFTSNPQTTNGSEAIDVLTLVSFDTGSLFGVLGKNYL